MNIISISEAELRNEDIVFNNENQPWEEEQSIELSFRDNSWGQDFFLWVNGQLVADFRTFRGLMNRATRIIAEHQLERV